MEANELYVLGAMCIAKKIGVNGELQIVAECPEGSKIWEAESTRIVHAVNNHDKLVKAVGELREAALIAQAPLRQMANLNPNPEIGAINWPMIANDVDAALKASEGIT